MRDLHPCVICGKETDNQEAGLVLCYEHAAVARRLAKALDAKTPFDLIEPVAHANRENPDSRPSTYQIAPDKDIERAVRDVDVVIHDVPVFAVEALFDRLFNELGRPDIEHATTTLEVSFGGLDEAAYARLDSFTDKLWMASKYEVTKVRLYPPERLMDEKIRTVDRERKKQAEREPRETA